MDAASLGQASQLASRGVVHPQQTQPLQQQPGHPHHTQHQHHPSFHLPQGPDGNGTPQLGNSNAHPNLDLSAPQASSLLSSAGPPPTSGPAIPAGTGPGGTPTTALSVYHLISQLCQRPDPTSTSAQKDGSEARRETALLELSKKREQYEDLALVLWHSFGVMSSLLQEIIAVYPLLSPPALTAHASNRVCNALALLQCVASHQETRSLFLQGKQSDSTGDTLAPY